MRLATLALCAAMIACGGSTADELFEHGQEITYGTVDKTNRYASTGAMLALREGVVRVRCSGTLIGPKVFLTAAHCGGVEGPIWVSFAKNVYASDAVLVPGTFIAHPKYNMATAYDIAVIQLSRAVDLTPVKLPPAGHLDRLAARGALEDARFVAAGYGVHERTDPPQPTFEAPDGWRRYASGAFISMNNVQLNLNQQIRVGNAGSCFGDSGGPNFLGTGNLQVSTTITGDGICENTGVTLRLDTPIPRAFLSQFVQLP